MRRACPVDADHGSGRFDGIGLGTNVVTGTVVRPRTMEEVLRRKSWPGSAVLVVEAIEPSWALVFPRFDAVVSELGGELSHAAILLREAEVPSVINASGAFHGLVEGDLVQVDPARGEVVRLGDRAKVVSGSSDAATAPDSVPAGPVAVSLLSIAAER